MAEITIKNFNGMNLKEGLWDQGFAFYSQSMDFYGLGDNQTNISYEGVIQPSLSTSAMAISASQVNSVMNDMVWLPLTTSAGVYGIDNTANNGQVYTFDNTAGLNGQWKLAHTISGSTGRNITSYNDATGVRGFYTNGTQLGKFDGTTWTDNFQTGLTAAAPMPMKVFQGYLFVANGRYIDRYDGSTYLSKKLQLPTEFTIRALEVFRDGLYISADNGYYSRIFIWDGSSPTFNDSIPLPNEKYAPCLQSSQGFLWIVGNRGGGSTSPITSLTPIYIIEPGAQPDLLFELPLRRDYIFAPTTGVAAYQNGVLIGSSEVSPVSFGYSKSIGGVWFIGKDLSTGLFHASLLFGYASGGIPVTVGAIFSSGGTQTDALSPAVYISVNHSFGGNSYGVDRVAPASLNNSNSNFSGPSWISLPITAGSTKNKSWTGLRINFDAMNSTNQNVFIYYDINQSGMMTLLKQFNFSASDSTTSPFSPRMSFIPIGRVGRTINIAIEYSPKVALDMPKIHSFTLYYEELEN